MIYTIIGLTLFVTDGMIKLFVEKKGKEEVICPALGGKLLLRKYHNTGAMLGIGAENPKRTAFVSIIFTVFMSGVYAATLGMKGKRMLKTGLALLLGGAYSNTYDRLRRKYVVDYVSFGVQKSRLKNVIFNISDFGIIIGAVLFSIGELLGE